MTTTKENLDTAFAMIVAGITPESVPDEQVRLNMLDALQYLGEHLAEIVAYGAPFARLIEHAKAHFKAAGSPEGFDVIASIQFHANQGGRYYAHLFPTDQTRGPMAVIVPEAGQLAEVVEAQIAGHPLPAAPEVDP